MRSTSTPGRLVERHAACVEGRCPGFGAARADCPSRLSLSRIVRAALPIGTLRVARQEGAPDAVSEGVAAPRARGSTALLPARSLRTSCEQVFERLAVGGLGVGAEAQVGDLLRQIEEEREIVDDARASRPDRRGTKSSHGDDTESTSLECLEATRPEPRALSSQVRRDGIQAPGRGAFLDELAEGAARPRC